MYVSYIYIHTHVLLSLQWGTPRSIESQTRTTSSSFIAWPGHFGTLQALSRKTCDQVAPRISKLSTMAAEVGLGLTPEANTAKAGGVLVV